MHPLPLATPWPNEAMWKGLPLKHDIRMDLTKVLMNGFQTDGVHASAVLYVKRLVCSTRVTGVLHTK